MKKIDKLLRKIENNPKDVRFEEIEQVLLSIDYYMSLKYPIKVTPIPEEGGGGYYAEIPELYGCLGDGETIEEALKNLGDVKYTTIEMFLEKGKLIPEPIVHLELPWSIFESLKQKEEIERFIRV